MPVDQTDPAEPAIRVVCSMLNHTVGRKRAADGSMVPCRLVSASFLPVGAPGGAQAPENERAWCGRVPAGELRLQGLPAETADGFDLGREYVLRLTPA